MSGGIDFPYFLYGIFSFWSENRRIDPGENFIHGAPILIAMDIVRALAVTGTISGLALLGLSLAAIYPNTGPVTGKRTAHFYSNCRRQAKSCRIHGVSLDSLETPR